MVDILVILAHPDDAVPLLAAMFGKLSMDTEPVVRPDGSLNLDAHEWVRQFALDVLALRDLDSCAWWMDDNGQKCSVT